MRSKQDPQVADEAESQTEMSEHDRLRGMLYHDVKETAVFWVTALFYSEECEMKSTNLSVANRVKKCF